MLKPNSTSETDTLVYNTTTLSNKVPKVTSPDKKICEIKAKVN